MGKIAVTIHHRKLKFKCNGPTFNVIAVETIGAILSKLKYMECLTDLSFDCPTNFGPKSLSQIKDCLR